jgi:hypothetical protein
MRKPTLSDEKLVDVLLAQRDEHVQRIFSLNGQIAILILTLSVTILLGAVSGTAMLSRIEAPPGSRQYQLLLGGAAGFAAAAVVIVAALMQHLADRRTAADRAAQAAAQLIAGESRPGVLSRLSQSMVALRPLSPPPGEDAAYLSTEVNTRTFGLTLYEKTFAGCVLLLGAALATGLGIVLGNAAASDSAEFAAALREAKHNVESPAGQEYDAAFGKAFAALHRDTIPRCSTQVAPSELRNFDILVLVTDAGTSQKVLVRPATKLALCVQEAMTADEYPAPPQPDFWAHVRMAFSRTPPAK